MVALLLIKWRVWVQYGADGSSEFRLSTAGYRLTASEEQYRDQWLDTVYATLQMAKVADNEAAQEPATDSQWLVNIVHRVLEGQRTEEDQSLVKFDRALATGGASGGAVAEKKVIAPQWIQISQLILLTMKVVNELRPEPSGSC
eukprot:SM000024S07783  [mRNA]  locus=s24:406645:408152:- [translate_table: standard]